MSCGPVHTHLDSVSSSGQSYGERRSVHSSNQPASGAVRQRTPQPLSAHWHRSPVDNAGFAADAARCRRCRPGSWKGLHDLEALDRSHKLSPASRTQTRTASTCSDSCCQPLPFLFIYLAQRHAIPSVRLHFFLISARKVPKVGTLSLLITRDCSQSFKYRPPNQPDWKPA